MTKRHFIALANALRTLKPESKYSGLTYADMVKLKASDQFKAGLHNASMETWLECVRTIATVCSTSNPRFNRHTFYSACGMEVN